MNTPYVSAVMTAFNAHSFIKNSLDSLKKQTLKNIEIIIIDDCSTDGTSKIISDMIRGDGRIKYIRNDRNRGAAYSRNIGLKQACGEYIIFLDDDDIFDIHMLEKSYAEAKCNDSDIHVFRSFEIFEDGSTYPMEWSITANSLPKKNIFSCHDVQGNVFDIFVWWCWDKLFKRNKIIENGLLFQETRTTNDLFFCCANYFLANKISTTDEVLIYHNMTREGSLSNTRHLSYTSCVEAARKLRDFMIENDFYSQFRSDFFNYIIVFFDWQLQSIDADFFAPLKDEIRAFFDESGVEGFKFDTEDKTLKYQLIMMGDDEEYKNFNLQEKNMLLSDLKKQLGQKETKVSQLYSQIENLNKKIESLAQMNTSLIEENNKLIQHLNNISGSRTWRMTYPVRYVGHKIKRIVKE